MHSNLEYLTLQDEQTAQHLSQLSAQCFIAEPEIELAYLDRIGWEQFRYLRQGTNVVGGLATLPMAQWFGGKPVPMTGIASVAIAPEARGSGVALTLMQQVLQELHGKGVALSTLYPAVQQLYRRAGYEQGGTFCHWICSTAALLVKQSPLAIEPISLDWQALAPLAQQQAVHHNGLLERHKAIWLGIVEPLSQKNCFAYRLGSAAAPEGYLVFSQERTSTTSILKVLDWVVLTPNAAQSFWAFLSGHRSQVDQVQWQGSALDLLSLSLPEQPANPQRISRWMTRIVCVEQALTARGYPITLEGELHLEVRDDLLPGNQGRWILRLSQGQAQIARGGHGDLKLDVRGLASLYTGLFTPNQLQMLGFLEGTEPALALAGQAFGGPAPWLADFF